MKPRQVVLSVALVLGLLATPLVVDAQQPGKVPTIGYLVQFSGAAGPPNVNLTAFLEGLRDLGYVDGKTIAIEYRYTEGKSDRLPDLAAELVRLKVDLIVTETGTAALRAKEATQTIPIVMEMSGDAVSQGLVASLAAPGGNVTGLTALSPAASGKRLQLLTEVVPKLTQVGVLWAGPSAPVSDREWAETRAAAQPLQVQLTSLEVRGAAEFPGAFAEAARQHLQAVLLFDIGGMGTPAVSAQLADLAAQHRLPMMFQAAIQVRRGGLMSYGPDFPDLCRRAATYVDRILKGANPAELPVGQPTKFDLAINLKAAKALDLTIPPSVLSQANVVIE
ncbi:MAG: ABC transporter substrate-binding protein [Candidatus Methylomirabilota bacterium]|jgi:putative ABC transport system substrate-binding protein